MPNRPDPSVRSGSEEHECSPVSEPTSLSTSGARASSDDSLPQRFRFGSPSCGLAANATVVVSYTDEEGTKG